MSEAYVSRFNSYGNSRYILSLSEANDNQKMKRMSIIIRIISHLYDYPFSLILNIIDGK